MNAVTGSCCRSPGIQKDGNPNAAVGVPYRYNLGGVAVLTKGTGPITWGACASGPAGFRVDATTGAIDWTPSAAGPAMICIQSTGACGTDTYSFTVSVTGTPATMPTAVITLPATIAVNTPAVASASLSTPNPAFSYRWDFGDGSPSTFSVQASHAWLKPGGYNVRLRVFDGTGQFSDAIASIAVTDPACATPPSARIIADQTVGTDSLKVAFSVEYKGSDPSPVYRWNLGDGSTATGASPTHTFAAGSFQVALKIVTAQGCGAEDKILIRVAAGNNQAPHCAVTAAPVAGPAPLTTTFTAVFGDVDGKVSSATWLFSDGVTADAMRAGGVSARLIDRPSTLTATLEVVDDRGAVCHASVEVEAGNGQSIFAPEIVSVPTLTAQCGVRYVYGDDGTARATGGRPITWSLGRGTTGKPEGMTIDANGAVRWTPAIAATHAERVTLVAENSAASVEQDFFVQVDCPQVGKGCGCGSLPNGGLAFLGLAALAFTARRRRAPPMSDRT